jgi:hypothetical protein
MGVLCAIFYRIKKKKKWGRGERGSLSCYNLNIKNKFTNGY